MTNKVVGRIVMTHNPVTAWESYTRNLSRAHFRGYSDNIGMPGWYLDAGFTIVDRWGNLVEMLEFGLGRMVRSFDTMGRPEWEGFINTLTLLVERGGRRVAAAEMSLDGVANKLWARYYDTVALSEARSSVYHDLDSQARFGVKADVMAAGSVTAAVANQGVQVTLRESAWPVPSEDLSLSSKIRAGEKVGLRVECKGFWDTLAWQRYNQTSTTGSGAASTIVAAYIAACGQFIRASQIDVNTTPLPWENDADRTPQDLIEGAVRFGDSALNPWTAGVGWDRTFFYRQQTPHRLPGA